MADTPLAKMVDTLLPKTPAVNGFDPFETISVEQDPQDEPADLFEATHEPGEDPVEPEHQFNDDKRPYKSRVATKEDLAAWNPVYGMEGDRTNNESDNGSNEFKLKAITSAELDSGDFTVSYHIDGLYPVMQPGVTGGPSKGLKTTLAVAAKMAISTGNKFLDRFDIHHPTRCCILSAESGFAALQRTGRAIAKAAGRTLPSYTDLLWCDQIINLGDEGHMRALTRFVTDNRIGFLALDPAYLLLPGLGDMASNMFQMGVPLGRLTALGHDCHCTIELLHHFKKLLGYEEPELEWLSHAGFANWARWWLLLNRRSKYDPENRGVHELWLHAGGSAGHSSAWSLDVDEGLQGGGWSVDVRFASEARTEKAEAEASVKGKKRDMEAIQASTAARIKVQDALRKFPRGGTLSDIAAVAKVSNKLAKGVLVDMVLGKAVIDWEVSKGNKQHYAGYILADLAQEAKAAIEKEKTVGQSDSPGDVSDCPGDTQNHPDNPS